MDEDLSNLGAETHLFAVGIICYADDEGYFNANPLLMKAMIFPLREPSVSVHGMLTELSNIGFVALGTDDKGKPWGKIVNFAKHQRVNRPTPSKIKTLPITWESSLSTHGGLTEDSLPEGKGKEGKGKEGNETPPPPDHPSHPTAPALAVQPTAGNGGEFMAATWLGEELRLALSPGDVRILAEVIRLESRDRSGDVVQTAEWIRDMALEARSRGEPVTVWWIKDRKFARYAEKFSLELEE